MWDYGEDNRGPMMAYVSIGMAVVSVLAVALRSYTMSTILKRFVFEDYLAVITCILQCGFCAVVVIGCSYGLGAHVEYVPLENRHKALQYKWAGQVAYIVVSTVVKFVIGIFLLRLCVNNTWQRVTIIVLLCIVGLFNAFYVFLAAFQCQPVAFYWYRYTENAPVTGKCNGRTLATIPTYFAVLIGLVSDLVLALLPATLIKGARLDKKTKISVCCVLALGSLASVATIARVPYAKQLLSNPDYLYNFTDLAIWSIVECGIAITASSAATLRPLFIQMKVLANSHFTSRYGHSRYGSGGLPIQSANSVVMNGRAQGYKRETAMTGSTAVCSMPPPSRSGGLKKVEEDAEMGIHVEKHFELSIITKEKSIDSLDRLEAEIDEVITPGNTRRKASYDQKHFAARRGSFGSQRPPALQTGFKFTPDSAENSAATLSPSPISGPRFFGEAFSHSNPSAPTTQPRRPSEGQVQHEVIINNEIVLPTNSPTPFDEPPKTPNFHLPSRLAHQSTHSSNPRHTQQSTVSNNSALSRMDSRGTWQSRGTIYEGLSAPPRVPQPDYAKYGRATPTMTPPMGSPIMYSSPRSVSGSQGRRPSAGTPPVSRAMEYHSQYPFPEQDTTRRGRERVSAFSTECGETHSANIAAEMQEEIETPTWTRASPEGYSIPSPLRSHPPGASGSSNGWL